MVKSVPEEEMIQMEHCAQQLITSLAENYNKKTPFRFAKIYIKDGFWRLEFSDTSEWNFCYVIPQVNKIENIEDIEVVVPKCLQMVWC